MEYRERFLENKVRELTERFTAILITGPRQAGKTSLLEHVSQSLFSGTTETIAFDTPSEINAFRRDPDLFFLNHPGVLFLDEIQHVPDIFPYLKREIDRSGGGFRFFLSGSQHFELMRGVTESLAGRTAVLDLWPFAVQEIRGSSPVAARRTVELLETPELLQDLVGQWYPATDPHDVAPAMLAGGYAPVALENGGGNWLESYRRTYVQRDIREMSQVADLGRFDQFLTLCAGRSGNIINKTEIGRTVGIDSKTVDHWLSLLQTSYQIVSLPSYHTNSTKRLVKRAKWIFADIGLCLHLQAIRDESALFAAPHFGHLFESFVIMEIRKLYGQSGLPWSGAFWRTPAGRECDLVLSAGGRLAPIEIKHASALKPGDMAGLRLFMGEYGNQAAFGVVVSLNPRLEKIDRDIYNVPLGLILNGPN